MKSLKFWTRVALVPALVLVSMGAFAEDKAPDPVGTWNVIVDMGGSPLAATLVVKQNDDKSYGGTLKSPLGELALEKVDYKPGEAISFGATIGEGDQAISFKFDGKFTGPDSFEGKLVSPTMGEMPVKGTRATGNPLAGVWDIKSDSQLGKLDRTLVIYKDNSGKYITDKDNAISNLKVDGANVSFDVTLDVQGNPMTLAFKGTSAGDTLNGNFEADGQQAAVITGTKSKADPVTAAIGKWKFEAETPSGPYNADLIIESATSGKLHAEEGDAELRNIGSDGDKLTYDVSVDYQGQKYDVSFAGLVKGDEINGDLSLAGSPVATVKCKKAAN